MAMKPGALFVALLGACGLFLTAAAAGPAGDLDPGPLMERMIRRHANDEAALRKFYGIPLSTVHETRLGRFLDRWTARLDAVGFDALDATGRVDYVLLRNHVQRQRDELMLRKQRNEASLQRLRFAPSLIDLEIARRASKSVDPRAAAARLDAARKDIENARAWLDLLDDDKVAVYRAAKEAAALRRMLAAWFKYRDGYEPEFGWWVRKPYEALVKALSKHEKHLKEKIAEVKDEKTAPLIGDPIGPEALQNALAREFIPYTPEQLLAIAQKEFAWCEAEGKKAAAELKLEDWAAVVEHVKGKHVPPGKQDDLVAAQSREAIAFLKERDLLTIPPLCEETWRLTMISAKGQKTLPFAVYNDQHMHVAYATEGMDHLTKLMSMRGNNEHFTRIVTPHELIPGHHLQLFQAKRHRPYRAHFRTAFLVEGWALHWEMLLWDLGWARDACDRAGMLFWRMHRCARIIVTLNFHLGRMKPEQMVDFLVKRVGLEKDGATGEVRRYIAGAYGPLYQCAYMLGGLQMRALYEELVGGGKMSPRAFHDSVLKENSIPIELIRAALTGRKLARDHESAWRFYGPVAPVTDGK